MLSLYNSLGLDGGSVSTGNKLLAVGNDVRGSFPQYDRTTLRIDIDPNDQGLDQSRADINRDNIVDGADLTILLSNWRSEGNKIVNPRADINQDEIVDGADLTILLGSWGLQFNVGDLGVATGSYDERPDLGVRPSRPDGEDDGGGEEPNPLVGVIQTINGLVYPTSRVNVKTSPALPAWIKERNV
tara:strand:- start:308 stop:865 length:558 start_codon:yes stop_codon:yes gene_type:complete